MSITLKIAVPPVETREWKTLEELRAKFSDQEIVEMAHRYCDAQDHARRYRVNRAARIKAMEAQLTVLGVDTKALV